MVYICICEFVMHFPYYKVRLGCQPLLHSEIGHMVLEFGLHLFKDSQALLVPVVHLSQQWEVVGCVLFKHIIFNYNHLKFFHGKARIHLNSALIN